MSSEVMEDYLKAIYALQRETGAPVGTSALAEYVGVTPPTASSMLETLDDRGLVDREKYRGVELTEEGETVALEVLRHHRLLESYLAEHLGYSWSEIHAEADTLEHHISEDFERRVAAALDDPTVDPHGDPIPSPELEPPAADDAVPLAEVATGNAVEVARVSDRDEDHLGYLTDHGVEPGARLTVTEITPIGTIEVRVDGETVSLPERIAASIQVEYVGATER